MYFLDVWSAIQWAEEYSTRPDLGSQIGKIMAGPALGNGEIVWDMALTISNRLSCCTPFIAGYTAQAIYGVKDPDRDAQIGWYIGNSLRGHEAAKRKEPVQLHKLGLAVLKAERAQIIFDDRYPLARMAHDIGISKQAFTSRIGWIELRSKAVEQIRMWMKRVEREMGDWLEERGWLEGQE